MGPNRNEGPTYIEEIRFETRLCYSFEIGTGESPTSCWKKNMKKTRLLANKLEV